MLKNILVLGYPERPGGWCAVAELGHGSALCVPSTAALGNGENGVEKNELEN